MLSRFILGIDPGKRSGVAIMDLLYETCYGTEVDFSRYGEYLENVISVFRPTVVAEKFVMNANTIKNTQAPWSLEAIGVARFLARKYGCQFVTQPQSSAKRFATKDRIMALGWYEKGKGHLFDAKGQTLLYATDHGWWHNALEDRAYGTIDDERR